MSLWQSLLRQFFSRPCPLCAQQLLGEVGLCKACTLNIHPRVVPYSSLSSVNDEPCLISLGRYRELKRAIHAFKYGGARELAQPFGKLLAKTIPDEWQIHGVLSVPIHSSRERERGYNQARLLAEVIADELEVPFVDALTRPRAGVQQAKQDAITRRKASNPYQVCELVPVGTLLLVDDVLTTGQTLRFCRDILIEAGAEDIRYATIAY